jgi:hypothetical protein
MREMRSERKCYTGPWPDFLVEGISYHEAGHALLAIHHGLQVQFMWAADGRPCSRGEDDDDGVHGMTGSNQEVVRGQVGQMVIADVMMAVGPEAAESLAPHYEKFERLHIDHPGFFGKGRDGEPNSFFNGTNNDLTRAFNRVAPIYMMFGLSPSQAENAFTHEFRIPAYNIIRANEKKVHALAKRLQEDRYLDGKVVHEIVCSEGGPGMPGCYRNKWGEEADRRMRAVSALMPRNPVVELLRMFQQKGSA